MATQFDAIIDRALVTVNDYRLSKLYSQSEEDFKTYCDGFLLRAVPYFKECRQNLTYDENARTFTADLTLTEQTILADLWAIQWYTKDNQTYALYRQHLQNSGSFKNHSEAQNLKENSEYVDKMREELARQIVQYQLEDISSYLG